MALQAAGRVPAMLNFTAGPHNLVAACQAAQIALVLTSRSFVEKAELGKVVEAISEVARIVWLEDVRESATRTDKLRAALTAGRAFAEREPGRSGGRPVHLRHRGRAEGRRAVARQPARQHRPDRRVLRPEAHRRLLQPAADLPRLRPDGRAAARAPDGDEGLPLPDAPALPPDSGAHRQGRRDGAVRHRHVPRGLRPQRRRLRLPHAALRHRRRRAAEGRDAPDLHGEVRPAPARGLWRDRGLAGARGQHAGLQQERHGRQAPALRRGAPRACARHRRGRAPRSCAAPT